MEMKNTNDRILVIDDDIFIRKMLLENLKNEGYEVFTAENGDQGLKLFTQHQPRVIILDLMMSKMDGIDFLERLDPKVNSSFSVIVLTGYGSNQEIQKCYQLGINSFLRKPVNLFELEGLVKHNFEMIRRADELIHFSNELQREMEEKERAYNLLKSTFNGMAEGVVAFDNKFLIRLISEKACRILGTTEEEILDKSMVSLLGAIVADPSGLLMQSIINGNDVSGIQANLLSPSGAVIPVSIAVKAVEDPDSVVSWLLFFRNLRDEERLMLEKGSGVYFGDMISCNPSMRKIFQLIETVATSNATVLIQGDSGTGKELVAREIHARSHRAQKPFHAVNCAAIPYNLLESEFFGHEKGAFTGAHKMKHGRFESANGGTLFLDEIGEIPVDLQVKLLRALQEQKFERIGGLKTIKVDVRIIASTNRDLKKMVQEKKFRDDLYYRLDVVAFKLPPLAQRMSDIPLLINFFIEQLNKKEKRKVRGVSPHVLQHLLAYAWPGNVRELYHAIEHAFAVSQRAILKTEHLPEKLREELETIDRSAHKPKTEQEAILKALEQSNFRKGKAAVLLGISYTTLYRKIKKMNLQL